jgi:hypothetical protein
MSVIMHAYDWRLKKNVTLLYRFLPAFKFADFLLCCIRGTKFHSLSCHYNGIAGRLWLRLKTVFYVQVASCCNSRCLWSSRTTRTIHTHYLTTVMFQWKCVNETRLHRWMNEFNNPLLNCGNLSATPGARHAEAGFSLFSAGLRVTRLNFSMTNRKI